LINVLFEFVYGLKQAIYTQLVVIYGQQNYTLNTKHVIAGVIEEGTYEAEVRGLPNKNIFLLFLKFVLCFLETIFTGGFITPTASENRFLLAVLSYPPVKMVISTDP
jgi:hypothetical protein